MWCPRSGPPPGRSPSPHLGPRPEGPRRCPRGSAPARRLGSPPRRRWRRTGRRSRWTAPPLAHPCSYRGRSETRGSSQSLQRNPGAGQSWPPGPDPRGGEDTEEAPPVPPECRASAFRSSAPIIPGYPRYAICRSAKSPGMPPVWTNTTTSSGRNLPWRTRSISPAIALPV